MTIKERAELFCEKKDISLAAFCRTSNVSNGYFTNLKGEVGYKICKKIAKSYPDLNLDWLQTGEGDMLNPPPVQAATMAPYPAPNITTGDVTGNGNSFVAGNNNGNVIDISEEAKREGIVFVGSSISTERGVDIKKYIENNAEELERIDPVELLDEPDHAERVSGLSMYPTLQPNDVVFIKILPDKTLIDGKMYYLNTKSLPTMVRTVKIDGDMVRLVAQNPNYGDIVINRSDILRVGKLAGMLRKTFGDQYRDIEIMRRKKEEQIDALIGHLGDSMVEISKQGARTDRLMEQNAELIKKIIKK